MSSRKQKVLVVATSRKTRGGITSVVKSHEMGEQWQEYQCEWIETHIDKGAFSKLYFFFRALIRYVFLVPSSDLVHIHTSEPPSAIRKLPFMFLAILFKKKIVVHFHSFSPDTTINSRYRPVYSYLFRKAHKVVVLSNYWKQEIYNAFKLTDSVVILFNPCSKPDYAFRFTKKKQILYAGTVNQRKGYADLIRAFSKIAKKNTDWTLAIAGNGELEKATLLAGELNIKTQTKLLGWISGKAKSRAFQEASIFCLPSYAEGFPMAVLDAWSYGLPVVTTPVGGLNDILINESNALVFEPGDTDTLSACLEKLIYDQELNTKLKAESIRLAQTTFSEKDINSKLSKIYQDLLR